MPGMGGGMGGSVTSPAGRPYDGTPGQAGSPGAMGGLYMSGDRAAFVRYKCLSCQSPAGKAEDARLSPMPQSFPPGSIMTSPSAQAQQSSGSSANWITTSSG